MPAIGYAGGKSRSAADVAAAYPQPPLVIHFPYHAPGEWVLAPPWMRWRSRLRRRNWRWVVDHYGCECTAYWEYQR